MKEKLHLFDGYGVEIEYMIVDRQEYRIRPCADLVLRDGSGMIVNERCEGELCWSNELVQHVIEMKTNGPAASLEGLASLFQRDVNHINRLLEQNDCVLLPGATHPFMNPLTETVLWEQENKEIYQAFNAIFDCRGHGWSNLQSMHINLPFQGPAEFFRLHSAIRFVLPFIPGLAASSPFQDGGDTGLSDSRMDHYGRNCARLPAITGLVVPEPVQDIEDYERKILTPIYESLAPHDPNKILQHEWSNARGAIARFERNAIEIRVIDSQECPASDLAVAQLVVAAVKKYAGLSEAELDALNQFSTEILHSQMRECINFAEQARIIDPILATALGMHPVPGTVHDFWLAVAGDLDTSSEQTRRFIDLYAHRGTLATRMRQGCPFPDRHGLQALCRELSSCLEQGVFYQPGG